MGGLMAIAARTETVEIQGSPVPRMRAVNRTITHTLLLS
jgi:hypothetical protein